MSLFKILDDLWIFVIYHYLTKMSINYLPPIKVHIISKNAKEHLNTN